MVGQLVFSGAFQATHVTTQHAQATSQSIHLPGDGSRVVVHDTPGLDQDAHYAQHRAQLQRAFEGSDSCGRHIVVFTLGVAASGRLNANDVHQLGAIVQAYDLLPESVLVVFNMLPAAMAPAAAEAYMAQVVAEMPPLLRPSQPTVWPCHTCRAWPPATSSNSTSLSRRAPARRRTYGRASLRRCRESRPAHTGSPALRPFAAAELRQEKEQLERERQHAAVERRAAEIQREMVRQEGQLLALEAALARLEARLG
jgi:hypothetical protein